MIYRMAYVLVTAVNFRPFLQSEDEVEVALAM